MIPIYQSFSSTYKHLVKFLLYTEMAVVTKVFWPSTSLTNQGSNISLYCNSI